MGGREGCGGHDFVGVVVFGVVVVARGVLGGDLEECCGGVGSRY